MYYPKIFGKNNNEYFALNMIYFLDEEYDIIDVKYSKDINKTLYDLTKQNKIIRISTNDDINPIKKMKYPRYPILLFEKNEIIITPILLRQIYGLPTTSSLEDCMEKIIINIKDYVGCLLTDNLKKLYKLKHINDKPDDTQYKFNKYNGFKNYVETEIEKNENVIKLEKSNSDMFEKCNHGWLSSATKLNLKYGIDKYKPKNILELGTWFGKSTTYMRRLSPSSNFYCFDKFQNICLSPYKTKKYNPLDKFYFTYSRLETFSKNIMSIEQLDERTDERSSERSSEEQYGKIGDVYAVKYDAYKSLEFIKRNGIDIDMIFIDFIKNQYKLQQFLTDCVKLFPNAIIVGDDYVFDTVKQGVAKFLMTTNYNVGILPESYIISKNSLIDHDDIKKEHNIMKNKLNNIQNAIFESDKDKYKYIVYLLGNAKYVESLDFIQKNKLNMNYKYDGDTTLFNEIAKISFSNNNKEIFNIFVRYQQPEKIMDVKLLTYQDYLDYQINL
jgi:predicted O-methyltransferase YrrM